MFPQQTGRGYDEAGRAVAALRTELLVKATLHGGQLPVVAERFDRVDPLALHGRRQREAREHRLVVNQHRAGAALAAVAPGFSAGQSDLLAQVIEQQNIIGDRIGAVAAIESAFKQTGHAFRPLKRAICALSCCRCSNISPTARRPEGLLKANSWEKVERLRRTEPCDYVIGDSGAADPFRIVLAPRRP